MNGGTQRIMHLHLDSPLIHGPEPTQLEGRHGVRFWVHHPRTITGHQEVDDALTNYPIAIFKPSNRDPAHTPIVIGLQGMAAPYQWSAFLVPTLLPQSQPPCRDTSPIL